MILGPAGARKHRCAPPFARVFPLHIIRVTLFLLIHSLFIRTVRMCPPVSFEGALARRVSAGAGNGARATIAAAN